MKSTIKQLLIFAIIGGTVALNITGCLLHESGSTSVENEYETEASELKASSTAHVDNKVVKQDKKPNGGLNSPGKFGGVIQDPNVWGIKIKTTHGTLQTAVDCCKETQGCGIESITYDQEDNDWTVDCNCEGAAQEGDNGSNEWAAEMIVANCFEGNYSNY